MMPTEPATIRNLFPRPSSLLNDHPWLTFLLPFIVYMAVGAFDPSPPKPPIQLPDGGSRPANNQNWFVLEYRHYPVVYTAKLALTIAAMAFVFPGYCQFPFRISLLAIVVGIVGVVLWIKISSFGVERQFVEWVGPQ